MHLLSLTEFNPTTEILVPMFHLNGGRTLRFLAGRGGVKTPIVRHCLIPRCVQSTPRVKTMIREGANDVRD